MKIRKLKQTLVFGIIVLGILFINSLYIIQINETKFKPVKKDLKLRTSYYNNSAEPIFIDGNATGVGAHNWSWAEDRPWCSGSGTWNDPYIIANLTIDAKKSTSCINITDSDVFLRIQNCTLLNSSSSTVIPGTRIGAGIDFYNVNNSVLVDNNCSHNHYGIFLVATNNNTLSNNSILNNHFGFFLEDTNNNTLSNNNVSNNDYGIMLWSNNTNNRLSINNIYNHTHGIELISSDNNRLWNNTITKSFEGIRVSSSHNNTFLANNVSNTDDNGIHLYYSNNNTFLTNTVLNSIDYGIFIETCNNNTFLTNTISNNDDDGIHLESSNNNTFFTNTVLNNKRNGINLHDSHNNNLSTNTILNNSFSYTVYGIYLKNSNNNILLKNNISNNKNFGIRLEFSNNNTLLKNNVSNNKEDGIFIGVSNNNTILLNTLLNNSYGFSLQTSHDNNLSMNTIINNRFDGFTISKSRNNTLSNNTISNNSYGIYLSESHNNTLSNNSILNNTYRGIFIIDSNNNTLSMNTISNNWEFGISLHNSTSNIIYNNTISNQVYYGIKLDSTSSNNKIILNYLINNTYNALDNGNKNQWDNGSIGNYWDDYDGVDADDDGIGEFPYNISGSALSQDNYPIWNDGPGESRAPTWNQVPTNQIVEYGDSFYYDMSASDSSGIDSYWINSTSNFYIDTNGVIKNAIIPPVNIYWLEIGVNDTYGNNITAVISIIVQDTTPPTWDENPKDEIIIEYSNSLSYDMSASDLSGIDSYWIISDTVNFHIDNNGLITNTTSLSINLYRLYVWVNDTYGNLRTATILIIVQDTTPPTWDENPTNQIIDYGISFSYDVNASDPSGINFYWLNNTSNFHIDTNGVITNATSLSIGEYLLQIRAYDLSNNYCSVTIKITVEGKAQANIIPGYNFMILLAVFGIIYVIYLKNHRKKRNL